jgi:DnaK suppressor protein
LKQSLTKELDVKTVTTPLTPKSRRKFILKAREHLGSMKAALVHELASDIRAVRSGSSGGGSMDSADLASEELEQRMTVMLSERERNRIIEIDFALTRMDEANYGVCEACGLDIAEPRLTVMPLARHCCDCQRDREREAKTRHRGNETDAAPGNETNT